MQCCEYHEALGVAGATPSNRRKMSSHRGNRQAYPDARPVVDAILREAVVKFSRSFGWADDNLRLSEHGAGIHLHCSETSYQIDRTRKRTCRTPVACLPKD